MPAERSPTDALDGLLAAARIAHIGVDLEAVAAPLVLGDRWPFAFRAERVFISRKCYFCSVRPLLADCAADRAIVDRMIPRFSAPLVKAALDHIPVVFIAGARQVGKSTLAREIVSQGAIPTSVSLDTRAVLRAAQADPDAFIAGLSKPVFIDEVQRVPELLLSIKDDLERNRSNGRYLLTGSADVGLRRISRMRRSVVRRSCRA